MQLLHSLHGKPIRHAKLAIALITLADRDLALATGLEGRQIKTLDGNLSLVGLSHECSPLTVDRLFCFSFRRNCALFAITDHKRNRSTLPWIHGDMHRDGVLPYDQRTYPDDIADVELVRLQYRIVSYGLSHSDHCH